MWPRTSCPLSSWTLNMVFGRASTISPSISIFSSLGTAGSASDGANVHRLRTLVAGLLLVLDLGVLGERLEPLTVDSRVVDEQVTVSVVRSDEAVALLVVEPLDGSGRHEFPLPACARPVLHRESEPRHLQIFNYAGPAPALTAPRYQGWAAEGSQTGAPPRSRLVQRALVGGRLRAGVALAACAGALVVPAAAQARMPAPRISVLSNRADLVSGGDALVRVTLPRGVRASRLRLTAGHRSVTRVLRRTGPRRLDGRVTGLRVGRVALTARIRRGSAARVHEENPPIGRPEFPRPPNPH